MTTEHTSQGTHMGLCMCACKGREVLQGVTRGLPRGFRRQGPALWGAGRFRQGNEPRREGLRHAQEI